MTHGTRPRLKTKPVDWTPYLGQEIPISGDFWHPSGHKVVAIVAPTEIEDKTISDEPSPKAVAGGEFLILSNGARTKFWRRFWLRDEVAILTKSEGLFTKSDLSMSIVDRVVKRIESNGQWIASCSIDDYRAIEMDSELGRILLEPCLKQFGSLDALKGSPLVTEVKMKKSKSTGSVGWGHRSMD